MADILKAMKQGPSKTSRKKGWTTTVLWEAGGGFDSNINNSYARALAIEYIHMNPVRRQLVAYPQDFRWSSSNWYHTDEPGEINVATSKSFGVKMPASVVDFSSLSTGFSQAHSVRARVGASATPSLSSLKVLAPPTE